MFRPRALLHPQGDQLLSRAALEVAGVIRASETWPDTTVEKEALGRR